MGWSLKFIDIISVFVIMGFLMLGFLLSNMVLSALKIPFIIYNGLLGISISFLDRAVKYLFSFENLYFLKSTK